MQKRPTVKYFSISENIFLAASIQNSIYYQQHTEQSQWVKNSSRLLAVSV